MTDTLTETLRSKEPRGCWFHDWVYVGLVDVTSPLRGPHDPRSKEARTRKRTKKVCAKCGKEKFESRGYWK